MTTQQLDQAKAEAFGGEMVGILNNAFIGLMVSVGHRTGLFDTMAEMRPSTVEEIARKCGLNERYVREWLGAMTVSRIVAHDPKAMTYALPPEHAASLTRAAGPGNLAGLAEYVACMGNVEDQIVECFRKGGGVPYSSFPRFQELMRAESAAVYDATLIDVTLPMVDGLIDKLKAGIDVADIACGAGHAINVMAKAFPKSRFTGYDFSEEGIARGRAEAAEWGLKNARFELKDAATLDGSTTFDFITVFDAIHDQAKPVKVLDGIAKSLKPGGAFLCVDIQADSTHAGNMEHPLGPLIYSISTFHCMTVSLAYDGDGLGTAWGEQLAKRMLNDAGFKDITTKTVEGDIMNNYYIARR